MSRSETTPPSAALRILGTSDLHMHLESYDYYSGLEDAGVGLVRTGQLIRTARAEAESQDCSVLLIDNGDCLQGTPLGDFAATETSVNHPAMACFAALGYDAIGLGNHDFDIGLPELERVLSQSPCPVLCSNLDFHGKGPDVAPHLVLDRDVICTDGSTRNLRIGMFSLLPPQTTKWEAHVLSGCVDALDIVDCARSQVEKLKARGCDVVVLLAHTGFGARKHVPGQENALYPLCHLDGIDAIIAGHTHQIFPDPDQKGLESSGRINGIPVAMPGTAGSHLAVIDLKLLWCSEAGWQVAESTSYLKAIARRCVRGKSEPLTEIAEDLRQLISGSHQETVRQLQTPVGETSMPLHSYFSFFAPDRSLALVAAAQAAAVRANLTDPALKAMPIVSAVSPGKFGGRAGPHHYTDIPSGQVNLRQVADLYVFPNELRAVVLTGAKIRDWLEMSAAQFRQVAKGSHRTPLKNTDFPGHNFDVLHGLTYEIDLSRPATFDCDGRRKTTNTKRIRNLCLNGAPLADDEVLIVTTNNYRTNGGGNFLALDDARCIDLPSARIRDILCQYLAGQLPHDPIADQPAPWRFTRMPGTDVTAQTGPEARRHVRELMARGATDLGLTENGFLMLAIPL
ncbi:bifunctional 2',3'-cyclic-nucleotide 2'-phosphodiesterase/3'-nucleotidase [Primorskyibacter sp. S87]|uniref:bifunctional 2',3'-cyclic-nucleotide 2'-phosphodiesterase/3'-nucleotidase n=1 Tax=Primorskyibacter sp. S87 TaxID=3415126 RepID=UPI003C7B4BF9